VDDDSSDSEGHQDEEAVHFEEFKPTRSKGVDENAEEILGDYERESFGKDSVQMPDGKIIPIYEYLGKGWEARIVRRLQVSTYSVRKS
jgi:hypothetical protein